MADAVTKGCGCKVDDAGMVVVQCRNQDLPTTAARRACGCCVAVAVVPGIADSPEAFVAYACEIMRWKRAGLTIEARSVGWVRHTSEVDGGLRSCGHRTRRSRNP